MTKLKQTRAISIYQNTLARVSTRTGRIAASKLKQALANPAYDTAMIRDLVRSDILDGLKDADSSRPLPEIINELVVSTMNPLLPPDTTTIQFVEPDDVAWASLEKAITRAMESKKTVERREILAGAATDLTAARVEATRDAVIDGTATVYAAGKTLLAADGRTTQPSAFHWKRVPEAGACDWCTSIVEQETAIGAPFKRHDHDRCTRRLVKGALNG